MSIFRTIIKVPDTNIYPTEHETLRPELGLESRLESGLAARVLIALRKNPLGRAEIAKRLGHQSVSSALHKQVRRLVNLDFIEMTLPQDPKNRLQKYRLTKESIELIKVFETN